MARGGITERRAARLGLVGALVVVLAQLVVASAWSLTHDDPTLLDLTRRCLEREKGLVVEATAGDRVAASAGGGTLRTVVEGGLVTIALATRPRPNACAPPTRPAIPAPGSTSAAGTSPCGFPRRPRPSDR